MYEITTTAQKLYEDRYHARLPQDSVELCQTFDTVDFGADFTSAFLAAADALNLSQGEFNAISDAVMDHSEPA